MVSAIKVLVFLKLKNTIILKIRKIKQIKQKETENCIIPTWVNIKFYRLQ